MNSVIEQGALEKPVSTPGSRLVRQGRCARLGNARAFTDLLRLFEREVYLLSFAVAGDSKLAEEIALEATYRAFTARKQISTIEQLRSSLIGAVISTGRDLAGFVARPEPQAAVSGQGASEPFNRHSRSDPSPAALVNALLDCAPVERVVIVLRDTLHFNCSEITEILNLPIEAVKHSLSSARLGICSMLFHARDSQGTLRIPEQDSNALPMAGS
jgi:DNA-directed RNA polymerase specialized sigma24 family protein